MTISTEKMIDRACIAARELGRKAARNAASWLSFEHESQARELQQLLADGDPRADEYLPAYPNLSGEWADDPTPVTLAHEVLGDDYDDVWDVDNEVDTWIADAWDEGVSETWNDAIEARIKMYLDSLNRDGQLP